MPNKTILIVGEIPESVDFSDPAIPPGTTAEKIHAGLDKALSELQAIGHRAVLCLVEPDASAAGQVAKAIADEHPDVVVVGGGLRLLPKNTEALEQVVDTIRRHAPDAGMAFNTSPEDSVAAAKRWI